MRSEASRFNKRFLQIALQIRGQSFVVQGNRRIRREIQNVRKIVAGIELRRLEIQDRGNQNDAVQVHSVALLQISGKPGRSCGSVAFPCQKFRRSPALVPRGVESNEIADRLYVFLYTMELFRRFAGNGAAVTG